MTGRSARACRSNGGDSNEMTEAAARQIRTARARTQVAALPFRLRDGVLEVMLITSRDTGRWIIPKGWPQRGRKAHEASAREAREEAGVIGKIGKKPIGVFRYDKRLSPETAVPCKVRVFAIEVNELLGEWPEKSDRKRIWLPPAEAARQVDERGLQKLLLDLPRHVRRNAAPRKSG
jgi:8-oxo-dGTP pyrophosphatase MutT (NUDIX family)